MSRASEGEPTAPHIHRKTIVHPFCAKVFIGIERLLKIVDTGMVFDVGGTRDLHDALAENPLSIAHISGLRRVLGANTPIPKAKMNVGAGYRQLGVE